ncbi:hypothetical protein REC12_08125 [Desulfosporosinus sp. PR]|nr:hypothetical protein [Desulfosporosinus sp. PR]
MFDEKNGYGESFDCPVMVTSNSGATWIDVTPQTSGNAPGTKVSGYFLDAQTGWTFRLQPEKSVTILGTQDGGQSWSQLATVPVKYGDGALFVVFSDARHGWFEETSAGINSPFSGELFATGDGGNTWQRVASTEQGNLPFAGSLSVQKDGTIWLIGAGIRKSTNGDKTWSQVNLPLSADQKPEEVSKPVFFENNDGVIIIQLQEGDCLLYTTHDAGRTWSFQSKLPPALRGSGVVYDFLNNREGWAINNGTGPDPSAKALFVTRDGGYSWQTVSINIDLKNKFVKEIDFVNSKVGWITYNQSTGSGLAKSINGGISWEEIKTEGGILK